MTFLSMTDLSTKPTQTVEENVLERIISPMSAAEFLERFWEKHFSLGIGSAGRYCNLFSWNVLGWVLEEHRLPPSRLRLFRNGAYVHPSAYQDQPYSLLKTPELLRELQNGATLILDCAEEVYGPLRNFTSELQSFLKAPVYANLYAAWKTDYGFDVHFDVQENIVIQVCGRKHWKVWKPTRLFPLKPDAAPAPKPEGPPDWEGILEDGSWLYIPRGWWHVAFPINEPSLHVTVTIVPFNGIDFLMWVAERCRTSIAARRNLPTMGEEGYFKEFLSALRIEIDNHLDERAVNQFLKERLAAHTRFAPALRFPALE
jgi:ribosomal protein L16 Arg81 hydroxylase